MLFKWNGRRNLLFATVLLSPEAQFAIDEGCTDQGCLHIRLPPILDSLYIAGVIWPFAGIIDGIIELDPESTLRGT